MIKLKEKQRMDGKQIEIKIDKGVSLTSEKQSFKMNNGRQSIYYSCGGVVANSCHSHAKATPLPPP